MNIRDEGPLPGGKRVKRAFWGLEEERGEASPSLVRSAQMGAVKNRHTGPEMAVRRLAHALGYRFRVHRKDLPGSPDIVFPSRHKVVFVHGCFWHRHRGCGRASTPRTRLASWQDKFARNVERDARHERELRAAGWDVLTIWECEARNAERIAKTLGAFLGPPGGSPPGFRVAADAGGC